MFSDMLLVFIFSWPRRLRACWVCRQGWLPRGHG